MFSFEKISLPDILVVLTLGTALIMAINNGMNELSMSIASGLLGYIGGAAVTKNTHGKDDVGAQSNIK